MYFIVIGDRYASLAAGIGNPGRRIKGCRPYNGPVGHVTSGHVTWEGASNAEVYELSRRREGIGNESAWSVHTQFLKMQHFFELAIPMNWLLMNREALAFSSNRHLIVF